MENYEDYGYFAQWASENLTGTEFKLKKDRVYMISCGARTYTWVVKCGVGFTTAQSVDGENEIANTIWREGDLIHSFDDDVALPSHALTDVTLIRYESKEFNEKVGADPELSWLLANYYHTRFTETLYRYKRMSLMSSEDQLIEISNQLAGLAEAEGFKVNDVTLSLFMGMHRVSINRLRKKLGIAPPPRRKGSYQPDGSDRSEGKTPPHP